MTEGQRHNRREFLRKATVVAWATPVVLTITAGRVGAQSLSCTGAGFVCGSNFSGTCFQFGAPCCSGLTCAPSSISVCICG